MAYIGALGEVLRCYFPFRPDIWVPLMQKHTLKFDLNELNVMIHNLSLRAKRQAKSKLERILEDQTDLCIR